MGYKKPLCFDCGKNTYDDAKDYYMVEHHLWYKYGVEDNMLCMDCMEKRLGHKLQKEDILDCPLNTVINPYTISILFDIDGYSLEPL